MAKDKRVEVLFDPDEYKRLEYAAQKEHKSVGALVREAVAKYVAVPDVDARKAAMAHLLSLDGGPVGSPEELKAEIVKGMDDYLARKVEYEAD